MDLARSVGFHVRREPNDHVRPSNMTSPQGKHYNNHADILLVKHDQRIYVDVTVTRPTCSSNMQVGKARTTPAHSARARTRAKHRKYDAIAACNQYQLLAFPMETYGGLGDEALELLHIMAQQSKDGYSKRQFLTHAFRRLSVTLQRANANIQSRGMHIMQMGDYAGLLAVRSPFRCTGIPTHRYSSPSIVQPIHGMTSTASAKMRNMRVAASTVGCHARRRLFVGTHTVRSHLADLHAGFTGDEDIEFGVTFDHIGTLCHADIADTGQGTNDHGNDGNCGGDGGCSAFPGVQLQFNMAEPADQPSAA